MSDAEHGRTLDTKTPERADNTQSHQSGQQGNDRLLHTLERLLTLEGTQVATTLNQASDLIAAAVDADKVDAFLYQPSTESLVAVGTSHTPMGQKQRRLGLDRIPLANDGPEVSVFQTGQLYHTGHAEQDPTIPLGMIKSLGVRSMMIVAMEVAGERRGVLQACSAQPDAFTEDELHFLQAVAHWVGTLTHRAELVEQIAHDAAERARQVVAEELVTVLAHDLGNYLTPLKARLQLIGRRARREGRTQDIEHIDAASLTLNRLQAIINDLLDIGRLDQGLFSVARQPLDLVVLAQECVGVMGTARRGVVLRAPEELVVEADPMRIRQALENLLSNALKHSPDGAAVDVELTTEKKEDGEWATIAVHDQGPGIPSEVRSKLFTRFAAGPNSYGLGLGLYLARSIAEAHQGTLTADSRLGEGSTFRLALPLSDGSSSTAVPPLS
jgi:signal transduction histidine kinase